MKIMVSAGEVSGDVHASYLIKELSRLLPGAYFFGMGADRLREVGVDVRLDISRRGTIGIFEALPNLFPIYFSYRKLVSLLEQERPDALILVDSQGINVPLAKAARKRGIKTIYYIAPQEWLWGTPAGVKNISSTLDLIIAIFEKEYLSYRSAGANVFYFGHPLIDIAKPSLSLSDSLNKYIGKNDPTPYPIISICPGSRKQEVLGLFPIFLASINIIKRSFPSARFFIPASTDYFYNYFLDFVKSHDISVFSGGTYDLLSISDLAICASGTINLEASLLSVPNLMVYRLSRLSYFIGKNILKIDRKLSYFSMPNILLDKMVVPELIMDNANPSSIAKEAISILSDRSRIVKIKTAFSLLRSQLGAPGVILKAATCIRDFILSYS